MHAKVIYFIFILLICKAQLYSQTVFDTLSNIYITEMHIHAWSNHNGANKPASMQWHAWQADSSQTTNVLWYTEHDGIYQVFDTVSINVDGASVDADNNIINLKDNELEGDNYWHCIKNDSTNKILISGDSMKLYILGSSSEFSELQLAYHYNEDVIKEVEFVKPLEHRPIISFHAETDFTTSSANCEFELMVYLAWHHRGNQVQDILWYKFVPSTELYSQTLLGSDTVLTIIPISSSADISLDLYNDALLLQQGNDNTLSDLQLKIGSKNNKLFSTTISGFKIYSSVQSSAQIIESQNQFISIYDSIYSNIHEVLGVEYSASDVHMNAFLPNSDSIDIYRGTGYSTHTDWTDAVHKAGGIVSYNHLFGMGWFKLDDDSMQTVRSDSTAMALAANQAYGADYLEVGYLKRGNVDLDRHLKAWDRCTANGLFLYGNGVSDSHGDIWVNHESLFATYVWAASHEASSLLASLSQGRCFIARPYYFRGHFYFSVGDAVMGDRTIATSTNIAPNIYIDSVQPGYKYALTQILINTSTSDTISYIYDNEFFDPNNPPLLDLTQASAIRITVYDSSDNPIIISQPIVFLSYSPITILEKSIIQNFSVRFYQTTDKNTGHIEINTPTSDLFIFEIYDSNGKLVKTPSPRLIYSGKYTFVTNLSELAKGSYILRVLGNRQSQSIKFIKK